MDIAGQITNLILVFNLAPKSTAREILDWYEYALENDLVEYVIDQDNVVVAFMDNIRLARTPKTLEEAKRIYEEQDHNGELPVLFVANGVSKYTELFWELIRIIKDKNKDAKVHCFHHRKRNRMVVLKKEAGYV